jgi:hypothetical protein
MDANEQEQQDTMEMTTNAQRVGSVFISESNFIARAKPTTPGYKGEMYKVERARGARWEEGSEGIICRYGRG